MFPGPQSPPPWLTPDQWGSLSPESQAALLRLKVKPLSQTPLMDKILFGVGRLAHYSRGTIYMDPADYGSETALHESLHGIQDKLGIPFNPAPSIQTRATSMYGVAPTPAALWGYAKRLQLGRAAQSLDAMGSQGHIETREQFAVMGQNPGKLGGYLTGSTLPAYRQTFAPAAIQKAIWQRYAQHRYPVGVQGIAPMPLGQVLGAPGPRSYP